MCYALLLLLKPLYFNFNCTQQHKAPFSSLLFLFTFPSSLYLHTTVVLHQARMSLKASTTKSKRSFVKLTNEFRIEPWIGDTKCVKSSEIGFEEH